MILYADIGNSRVKLIQDNNGFGNESAFLYNQDSFKELLAAKLTTFPLPEDILVSNVAGSEIAHIFTENCKAIWSKIPEYLMVSRESCGVNTTYKNIEQLGVDRWMAIIAAWQKYRCNLCVFDCGSAVTADVVSANGIHYGGYILPGQNMMVRTLAQNTGKISYSDPGKISGIPGQSTEECITNGTILAVSSFIESTFNTFKQDNNDPSRCVITGGGAESILGQLSVNYDLEPLLVFEGMKIVSSTRP